MIAETIVIGGGILWFLIAALVIVALVYFIRRL